MTSFLDNTRDSQNQILNAGGKIYSAATGSQSVAANGYLALEITNPADSNKMIGIIRVEGGSTADAAIDILRNAPITVSGLALTPQNRNWSSLDNSAMTVKYVSQSSDPTSGGDLLTSVIQINGPISISYDGEFIIPNEASDKQFTIRAENSSSEPCLLAIGVTWVEVIKSD